MLCRRGAATIGATLFSNSFADSFLNIFPPKRTGTRPVLLCYFIQGIRIEIVEPDNALVALALRLGLCWTSSIAHELLLVNSSFWFGRSCSAALVPQFLEASADLETEPCAPLSCFQIGNHRLRASSEISDLGLSEPGVLQVAYQFFPAHLGNPLRLPPTIIPHMRFFATAHAVPGTITIAV